MKWDIAASGVLWENGKRLLHCTVMKQPKKRVI
jgi:hypothetical protein